MKLVSVALVVLLCLSSVCAQNLIANLFNSPLVANGLGQDFGVTFSGNAAAATLNYIAGGPTFLSITGTANAQFVQPTNNAWQTINNGLFENNVLTAWRFPGQVGAIANFFFDPQTIDFSAMDATRTVAWTVQGIATSGTTTVTGARRWFGGSGADLFNLAGLTTTTPAFPNVIYGGDGGDIIYHSQDNSAGQDNQDTVYAQSGNDYMYVNPGTATTTSAKLADGGTGVDTVNINAVCNPGGATPPNPLVAALFLYQSAALTAYPVPTSAPALPIVDAPSGNQFYCGTALASVPGAIPVLNYNNAEWVLASIANAATQQASFIIRNSFVRNPIVKFTITPNGATSTVALALNNASLVDATGAPLANTAFVQPTTLVTYDATAITNFELNTGAGTNDIEVNLPLTTPATNVYLVVNGEATQSVIFNYPIISTTDQKYLLQENFNPPTDTAFKSSTAVTNILRLTGNGVTPPVTYGNIIYTPATHRASYPRNPALATLGFVLSGGTSGLRLDWSAIPIIYDLIPATQRIYDFTNLNAGSEDEMDLFLYLSYPGNGVALLKTSTGTQYFFTLATLTSLEIRTKSCVTVIGDTSQFFGIPNAPPAPLIVLVLKQNSCCCTTRFPVPFCVQQPKSCFAPNTPTNQLINQV